MLTKHLLRTVAFYSLATCFSAQSRGDIIANLVVDTRGTFDLYLSDNFSGDTVGTFGIVAYGVQLTGGILTLDHNSPNSPFGQNGTQSGTVGFTDVRSPDGDTLVTAIQKFAPAPGILIRGFGQVAGDLATAAPTFLFAPEQPVYGAPLLIATGTWAGTLPGIDLIGANVFRDNSTSLTQAATIVGTVSVVPEPSAGLLSCSLLGLGLLSRRRKVA